MTQLSKDFLSKSKLSFILSSVHLFFSDSGPTLVGDPSPRSATRTCLVDITRQAADLGPHAKPETSGRGSAKTDFAAFSDEQVVGVS